MAEFLALTGFTTDTDAQTELDHALTLLALADRDDTDTLTRIGDALEHALTHKEKLPTTDELRRRLRAGDALSALPTVGEWLAQWLPTKRALAKNTVRSYESHIRLYLTPNLGQLRLDRLKLVHLADMYEAIEEFNDRIRHARTSNDPKLRAKVKTAASSAPPPNNASAPHYEQHSTTPNTNSSSPTTRPNTSNCHPGNDPNPWYGPRNVSRGGKRLGRYRGR